MTSWRLSVCKRMLVYYLKILGRRGLGVVEAEMLPSRDDASRVVYS